MSEDSPEYVVTARPALGAAPGSVPNSVKRSQSSDRETLSGDCGDSSRAVNVAVLFARRDSIYKKLGCDVYDAERNALGFSGGKPVVAHPPCGPWGCLRNKCQATEAEKALAPWAVQQVRRWGGVLEHPERSTLWEAMQLPPIGKYDRFGGFTLKVQQHWWGHRARKSTLLYICGPRMRDVPPMPLTLREATHVVTSGYARSATKWSSHRSNKPEISKSEREHTPIAFARWLILLALLAGRVIATAQAGASAHERGSSNGTAQAPNGPGEPLSPAT